MCLDLYMEGKAIGIISLIILLLLIALIIVSYYANKWRKEKNLC